MCANCGAKDAVHVVAVPSETPNETVDVTLCDACSESPDPDGRTPEAA